MSNPPHIIIVNLNWEGFDGKDVDELMPDFAYRRKVRCELEWQSSCEGPDSYRIIIEIGLIASLVARPFLEELAKDIYGWCKAGLGRVFRRKTEGDGWTIVRFKDTKIMFEENPSTDEYLDILSELPDLISSTDLSRSKEWIVEKRVDHKRYELIPMKDAV